MDARVKRLARKIERQIAEKLVAAGFDSPKKIKAARDMDLAAIDGIGRATISAIREHFPRGK